MNRKKAKAVQAAIDAEDAEAQRMRDKREAGSLQRDQAVQLLQTYASVTQLNPSMKFAFDVAIACTKSIDYHLGIKK